MREWVKFTQSRKYRILNFGWEKNEIGREKIVIRVEKSALKLNLNYLTFTHTCSDRHTNSFATLSCILTVLAISAQRPQTHTITALCVWFGSELLLTLMCDTRSFDMPKCYIGRSKEVSSLLVGVLLLLLLLGAAEHHLVDLVANLCFLLHSGGARVKDSRFYLPHVDCCLKIVDEGLLTLNPSVGKFADFLRVEAFPHLPGQISEKTYDEVRIPHVDERIPDVAVVLQVDRQVEKVVSTRMLLVKALQQHLLSVLIWNVLYHNRSPLVTTVKNLLEIQAHWLLWFGGFECTTVERKRLSF